MLLAKEMVDLMRDMYTGARQRLDQAHKDMTEADREISRLYHELELISRLDAATGYKYAKALQEQLIKRRQAKWDISSLKEVVAFANWTEARLADVTRKVGFVAEGQVKYHERGFTQEEVS